MKPPFATQSREQDDRGATSVEYALIAGLIAVVIVAAVAALGLSTAGWFGNFNTKYSECSAGVGC